jgi:hypothetical protein
VVFVPTPENQNATRCCQACLTPLGDLNFQLGLSKSESMIGLEEHATVLQFTSATAADNEASDLTCACGVQWCGKTCREFQRFEHALLCCGDPKDKKMDACRRFREHAMETGGTPFLLAGQAIARVLGAVKRDSEKLGETCANWKDEDLFWWREYSHPLYWELGLGSSPKKQEQLEKKAACEASHQLLLESFGATIADMMIAKDCGDDSSFLTHMLTRICTLENVGEILGMLQCNVMEVEFSSPVEQYISHLQQIVEDAEDEENEDNANADQQVDTKEYRAWVENYLAKQSPSEQPATTESESETNVLSSITGSGLFPILTLANHDCDPNASIEFLGESNQGSLVSLRDIACGEEITITYIPNGDMDCGDDAGNRFRHFQPTRTWVYLNQNANKDCAGGNEDDSDQEIGSVVVDQEEQGVDDDSDEGDCDDQVDKDDEDDNSHADGSEEDDDEEELEVVTEGASWEDRAKSLLNYGFPCRCARCEHEEKEVNSPYCRRIFSETNK